MKQREDEKCQVVSRRYIEEIKLGRKDNWKSNTSLEMAKSLKSLKLKVGRQKRAEQI